MAKSSAESNDWSWLVHVAGFACLVTAMVMYARSESFLLFALAGILLEAVGYVCLAHVPAAEPARLDRPDRPES